MIIVGDCIEHLKTLPAESVQTCITSPPYWGLRDYGVEGQLGHEPTPHEYVTKLVAVFREVHRVLRNDGTLWLNIGDSYAATGKNRSAAAAILKSGLGGGKATQGQSRKQQSKIAGGLKQKDLCGIPWRVAFALQDEGWYLRQDIIWHKPNPMPESVRDRCTKSHEYIFLLSKSPHYYFNHEAIKEPAVCGHRNSPLHCTPGRAAYTSKAVLRRCGLVPSVATSKARQKPWQIVVEIHLERSLKPDTSDRCGRYRRSHSRKHTLQHSLLI